MKCAYCCRDCKKTRDHVPPKKIFPKSVLMSLHSNLATVSSCGPCNQGFSTLDLDFKILLAFRIEMDPDSGDPLMKELFDEVMTSLHSGKQKLKRKIGSQLVNIKGQTLLEIGKDERSIMKKMCERLVKGLYCKIYKMPIESNRQVTFKIFDEMKMDPHIFEKFKISPITLTIDARVFSAEHVLVEDKQNSVTGIWRFTFFNKYKTHAVTYDNRDLKRFHEHTARLLQKQD